MALHTKELKKNDLNKSCLPLLYFEYKYKMTLLGRIYTLTHESTFKVMSQGSVHLEYPEHPND